jgi:2-oxoglutarate dehydrogenase E2 component (dihydrolipoamide succinyltransferase)
MTDIKVPAVGESISEVTLVKWLKKEGDYVNRDEVLCELESEKATFELNAEQAGILHIKAEEGATLAIGDLACSIDETAPKPAGAPEAPKSAEAAPAPKAEKKEEPKTSAPAAGDSKATPVANAIMADKQVKASEVKGSGSKGRIMKQDVLDAIANPGRKGGAEAFSRDEKREKMSNLRKTVSRRLVEAKNSTAMLTTFNEVDMTRIMDIRKAYKDTFKESHGVNLGFMSFFAKACCIALQEWPAVNAYIDGESLVYHDYCDISIAVSAPKGLVVPVIRNAESLSMAGLEQKVVELAKKARDNKLSPDEMAGGTFTITNGGVFGSLMSTPIINIPQSAILGMHKIQDRPMAINGKVEIRPMMYLALSYDHRIIDGRESVGFLVRVKELLESPEFMLFGADPVKTLLEI